jgi:hypothetical protein
LSGGGTNEYYCELVAGGDPSITKPGYLWINSSPATEGTLGSLSAGEWDYGDNDSLGYSTLYVRLSDGTDPDTKGTNYIEGIYKLQQMTVSAWAYKPDTDGANPYIVAYYDPGGAGQAKRHTIPKEEWTRISQTYTILPSKTSLLILIGPGYFAGPANGTCYIDGIEIVEGECTSPIYDDSRGMDGDLRVGGRLYTNTITTFSNGDTTPGVSAGNIFKTTNTGATTITRFDYGVEGQEIKVIFGDGNTTVDFTGTNLKGNGGADWTPSAGDHMTCVFDGTNWYCNISDNT